MSWKEVKEKLQGPFISFKHEKTQKMFIVAEPEIIIANKFQSEQKENIAVLPVIQDGKFRVLSARSTRLREQLMDNWDYCLKRNVEVEQSGTGTDTYYAVRASKSKKKPDGRIVAAAEKAFKDFCLNNVPLSDDIPI